MMKCYLHRSLNYKNNTHTYKEQNPNICSLNYTLNRISIINHYQSADNSSVHGADLLSTVFSIHLVISVSFPLRIKSRIQGMRLCFKTMFLCFFHSSSSSTTPFLSLILFLLLLLHDQHLFSVSSSLPSSFASSSSLPSSSCSSSFPSSSSSFPYSSSSFSS